MQIRMTARIVGRNGFVLKKLDRRMSGFNSGIF